MTKRPAVPSGGIDPDPGRAELLQFLTAQRQVVLDIVSGLDDAALQRSVVPSGWTPIGMVEHLAGAERFWFQRVVADQASEPSSPAEASDDVFAMYRDQCARSDAVLATTPLDAAPRGKVPEDMTHLGRSVRTIVLHMIEETARHAGHLDIARELIDGRTGLGPR
jgi:hypothetical protein